MENVAQKAGPSSVPAGSFKMPAIAGAKQQNSNPDLQTTLGCSS